MLSLYDIHRGKYTEAQKLCQKALDVLENTLGRNHPNVVKVLETIAQLNNRTKIVEIAKLHQHTEETEHS